MYRGDAESAKHQLQMAVLGNWRDGVVAMAGVICVGGLVSNYKRLVLWVGGYMYVGGMVSNKILCISLNFASCSITCSQPSSFIIYLVTCYKNGS